MNFIRNGSWTTMLYAITLTLSFFPITASAADNFCCAIKTKPGVTPQIEDYREFSGEYACYTALNCEAQEAQCNATCTCDQPMEKCKAAAGLRGGDAGGQPYLVTYLAKGDLPDYPKRTTCTLESDWCTKNDHAPNYCIAVPADCTKCPDFDYCKSKVVKPGEQNSKPIPPFTDPLNSTDLRGLIARAIKFFTGISGSFALLMFIYGGFMWVTSAGSDEKVKKGKAAIANATIGLIIIFTAYAVISSVFNVLAGASL